MTGAVNSRRYCNAGSELSISRHIRTAAVTISRTNYYIIAAAKVRTRTRASCLSAIKRRFPLALPPSAGDHQLFPACLGLDRLVGLIAQVVGVVVDLDGVADRTDRLHDAGAFVAGLVAVGGVGDLRHFLALAGVGVEIHAEAFEDVLGAGGRLEVGATHRVVGRDADVDPLAGVLGEEVDGLALLILDLVAARRVAGAGVDLVGTGLEQRGPAEEAGLRGVGVVVRDLAGVEAGDG